MKHYLFECIEEDSGSEGEYFLVGADSEEEAKEIAADNFGLSRLCGTVSDLEAELTGLDEY